MMETLDIILGSQMIQIAGISALDKVDHFIKEVLRIKYYLRYMDDFLIICDDLEYLEYCLKEIDKKLKELGFTLHPKKTRIYKLNKEIKFLGFTHRLTNTGKVVMLVCSDTVRRERRKLVRMSHLVQKGYIKKSKVDECYQSWKAHAGKGNSYKLLKRMDEFYRNLWR